jgi:hypothetical protein
MTRSTQSSVFEKCEVQRDGERQVRAGPARSRRHGSVRGSLLVVGGVRNAEK